MKIKFEKPLFTRTMYGNAFENRKGSDKVGALDDDGRNMDSFRRTRPIGDLEKSAEVPLKFVSQSSNGINFTGIGKKRLPTPNKMIYEPLRPGNGKFYAETAYA